MNKLNLSDYSVKDLLEELTGRELNSLEHEEVNLIKYIATESGVKESIESESECDCDELTLDDFDTDDIICQLDNIVISYSEVVDILNIVLPQYDENLTCTNKLKEVMSNFSSIIDDDDLEFFDNMSILDRQSWESYRDEAIRNR